MSEPGTVSAAPALAETVEGSDVAKTTLYRLYDEDGRLLYVGIGGNVGRRMEQHADHKSWWDDVCVIVVKHYGTRGYAEEAESAAIARERPLYNIAKAFGQMHRESGDLPKRLVRAALGAKPTPEAIARLTAEVKYRDLDHCRSCNTRRVSGHEWRATIGMCRTCAERVTKYQAKKTSDEKIAG